MSENRITKYHNTVKNYRAELRAIWQTYDEKMQSFEKYKGSNGYDEEKKKAEAERNKAIKELQDRTRPVFTEIINGMKSSAVSQKIDAPTAEQLAILQALKMRDKVSSDELHQASRTLEGNPLCLSVLDEIAAKNNYHGLVFSKESTAAILEHIKDLHDSAKRLCALEKCDSRAEMAERASVHSVNHSNNALYSWQADKDFDTEKDAMRDFGGVADFETFSQAVNG